MGLADMWTASNEHEAAAIAELSTLSGRAAAIVAGSLLERKLEVELRAVFHDNQKQDLHTELFRPSGPLGSFSTKAKIAFAIGLISADGFKDLLVIIGIRNDFAHDLSIRDFATATIRDRCRNLGIVERHVVARDRSADVGASVERPRYMLSVDSLDEQLANPRSRFLLAIQVMIGALNFAHQDPKPNLAYQRF